MSASLGLNTCGVLHLGLPSHFLLQADQKRQQLVLASTRSNRVHMTESTYTNGWSKDITPVVSIHYQ